MKSLNIDKIFKQQDVDNGFKLYLDGFLRTKYLVQKTNTAV